MHVIDQLGLSNKQALAVVAQQAARIRELEAALAAGDGAENM